jgi:hypothetical protein
MTPQEFSKNWTENGGSVSPIDPERLIGMCLLEATVDFLIHSGLPLVAPPHLTFAKDTDDLYEGITKLRDQYDFLESEYSKFISIGYDAGGNSIAINTDNNDLIEWLDQENGFSSRFMNSSITQLTDFLIFYRDFIKSILEENGEEAYEEAQFTDDQFAKLKEKMMQADQRALTEGFWKEELDILQTNRAKSLDKKTDKDVQSV